MINNKVTKTPIKETPEERLFKLLEGIDWKLWEMYNMMKDIHEKAVPEKVKKKKEIKPESEVKE